MSKVKRLLLTTIKDQQPIKRHRQSDHRGQDIKARAHQRPSASLDDIDDDCLSLIFNHLDVNDKTVARVVCRRWKALVDRSLRHKQRSLTTQSKDVPRWSRCCQFSSLPYRTFSTVNLSNLVRVASLSRNLRALNLHNVQFTPWMLRKLTRLRFWSRLMHLEICYCNLDRIDKMDLIDAINMCKLLEHFSFYKTSDLLTDEIITKCTDSSTLTSVTIGFHTFSSHLSLEYIGPNVQRLEIHGLGLALNDLERLAGRPQHANDVLYELRIKNSHFTPGSLDLVTSRFPNLKTLDIPLPDVNYNSESMATQIASTMALLSKLERVGLVHRHLYEEVSIDKAIIEITRHVGHQLKSLSVGFYKITDLAVDAISAHCPNLEEFHALFNEVYTFGTNLDPTETDRCHISDKSVTAIGSLKKLHTLNLSLSQLTDEGIHDICEEIKPLRRLELNCCSNISERSIMTFLNKARLNPNSYFNFVARNIKLELSDDDRFLIEQTRNLKLVLR